MKLLIVLALTPLALAAVSVEKRLFIQDFLDLNGLNQKIMNGIVHMVGADATEQACESTCHSIILGDETAFLHIFCYPICRSLQALAQQSDHTPTEDIIHKRDALRSLLNLGGIRDMVCDIIKLVGEDATEEACEGACHSIVLGPETALLHTFCSPICHSLQALVSHFANCDETVNKRAILGSLMDLDGICYMVNDIINLVGADTTEEACEGACHSIVLGPETALLHTFCSPICHSLQALAAGCSFILLTTMAPAKRALLPGVGECEARCPSHIFGAEAAACINFCMTTDQTWFTQHYHTQLFEHTPTEATVGKRSFLSGLIDTTALTSGVQQLLDFVGTDASEQVCEMGCHRVVVGDETSLFHTFCTPICRSLQTLVHTFHLAPSATTTTAAP